MKKEIQDKYLKAGQIAAEVRETSKSLIKTGANLGKIGEAIEKMVSKKNAGMAFPVNLSLNEIAAHYTPIKNETIVLKETDVIKVDIGVEIDGYIGDTAYTISLDKKNNDLVNASKKALAEAIKISKPGTKIGDIGEVIQNTIEGLGFKPISNLTGHGLEQNNLHAEPQIPNIKVPIELELQENQVIAIEPFATTGEGAIKESDPTVIFTLIQQTPVRNENGRKILNYAKSRNGLPFAERWIPLESIVQTKIALRELRSRHAIYDYPVLKEVANGIISQAEHTIIVKDKPIITTEIKKPVKTEASTHSKKE